MHFAEENLPYSPILQPSASPPKPQWGRSQRTRRASNFNQNWVPEIDNNRDTFGTIHQVWKAEVNDALAAETKKREDGQRKDKAWFRLNLDGGKSRCAPGWGELE